MDLPAGYQMIEPLGSGGFGSVYRALDPRGAEVALKIVRLTGGAATEGLFRLQSEIELLKRARCPQVVEVRDYGPVGAHGFFIAMEVVRGRTLREHLADGPLPVPLAVRLVAEAADAVAHLHDMSVLHRDLKPENILIVDLWAPTIKLVDFGVSLLQPPDALPSRSPLKVPMAAGTVGYMAPECFAPGASPVDATSDLYALGVILYELVAGARPFDGASREEVLARMLERAPAPPSRLSAQVPEVIDRIALTLLEREPGKRYQLARCLRDDLRRVHGALRDGREEPIELQLDDPRGARLTRMPLFGRTAELELLTARRDEARRARAGELILIGGAAGVGKSRLATEALRGALTDRAALVGTGRCRQDIDLIPYAPIREALAELGRTAALLGRAGAPLAARFGPMHPAQWRVVQAMLPELAELCGGPPPEAGEAAPLPDHALAADALGRLARAIAADDGSPALILIEDLHWSEPGLRAVLRALATLVQSAPLIVLGTFRSEEVDPAALLGAPGEPDAPLPPHRLLTLAPLGAEQNRAMVEHLAGDAALADLLLARVPLLAHGVPLFNVELAKVLLGEGRLEAGARLDGFEVPDSISRLLSRTTDRLDETQREILSLAALFGRSFSFRELEALGRFPPLAIVRALDAAVQLGVCRPSGDGYLFAHEAVRQVFVDRVPPGEQAALHAAIAQSLAGEAGRGAGVLAHHLERAGQPMAAARRYVESAEQASAAHDPERARAHLERALKLSEPLIADAPARALYVDVATRLAAVGAELGQLPPLFAHLERCESLVLDAPEPPPPEVQAALHAALAKLHYLAGNAAQALVHSQLAIEAPTAHRLPLELQVVPLATVGRELATCGRFSDAIPHLELAAQLLEEQAPAPGQPRYAELAHVVGVLSFAYAHTGQFQLADRAARRSLDLAQSSLDPVRTLAAHVYRAAVAEARADWRGGLGAASAAFQLCEATGLGGHYLYLATLFGGRLHFLAGHVDRARYLLDNAIALSSRLGVRIGTAWANAFLGDARAAAGRWGEARASYERALDLADQLGDLYGEALAHLGLARVRGRVDGNGPAAAGHLKIAQRVLKRGGGLAPLARGELALGPLLSELGESEAGARASREGAELQRCLGLPDELPDPVVRAPVHAPRERETYDALWAATRLMQTLASTNPPIGGDGRVA